MEERYSPSTHIARDSGAELLTEKNVYDGKTELVPDILDNAFVTVDFENGVRAMLDLCMFAEASTHQEHLCVTGKKGKVEAFAPAHGEKVLMIAIIVRQLKQHTGQKESHILRSGRKTQRVAESQLCTKYGNQPANSRYPC